MPPPPPAHLGALTSRRIIKYKYTRYYLEWLQMACLERCIKWSWNLIFGAEKENFSPLILSLEVWIQRWVIPQHNEVTGLWKIKIYLCKNRSGSDNMKQNLEIIFNLHFWLSMKNKWDSWWCLGHNSHWLGATFLTVRGSKSSSRTIHLTGAADLRADCATSQVRSRLLGFKSHFKQHVGSTGSASLSGG